MTAQDTEVISPMGPSIAEGSAKALGTNGKPTSRVRAAQGDYSEGRSDTKGGQ
jgi:hypothetical protein